MFEVLDWFDLLDFYSILTLIPILFVIEFLTVNSKLKVKSQKYVLINSWQFLGVFVPGLWLLRCSESALHLIVLGVVIVFFGVYKPIKYKPETETTI